MLGNFRQTFTVAIIFLHYSVSIPFYGYHKPKQKKHSNSLLKEKQVTQKNTIERVPDFLDELHLKKSDDMDIESFFTEIYENNYWQNQETRSGEGSTVAVTNVIRASLPDIIKSFNISSLLDIPCGDFNWMKHIDLREIDYIGADIVKPLIDENNTFYKCENRKFHTIDILNEPLPKVDLILCRDLFVHLSEKNIKKAILNCKKSGSKFLFTTTFTMQEENIDTSNKPIHWRKINLEKAPFNFPKPLLTINENSHEYGQSDKCLCLWKISDLPN